MTDKLQVTVYIAQSVDGFIARPDGDVSWLEDIEPIGEAADDGGFGALMASVDAVVMGRNTFEKVVEMGWWGYGATPIIVLSRSLGAVPAGVPETVRIESAEPAELVRKLRAEGMRRIYLDGGRVIQSFLREGLVDDLTITTLPVLIGRGIPLFGELDNDIRLRLVSVRPWGKGAVQSLYEVS